ncbi:unnamed protein product, partial [Prorocentrum cordatum]
DSTQGTRDATTLEQQQSFADQEEVPNTKDYATHEKKHSHDYQEETLNAKDNPTRAKQQNRDDQDPTLGTKDTSLEQQSFTDPEEALSTKNCATREKHHNYDGLDRTLGTEGAAPSEQQGFADQRREDNAAREVPPTFFDLDATLGTEGAATLEQQSYADQEETLNTDSRATYKKQHRYDDQGEALGKQGREDNEACEVPPTVLDLVCDVVRMRLEEGYEVTALWMHDAFYMWIEESVVERSVIGVFERDDTGHTVGMIVPSGTESDEEDTDIEQASGRAGATPPTTLARGGRCGLGPSVFVCRLLPQRDRATARAS